MQQMSQTKRSTLPPSEVDDRKLSEVARHVVMPSGIVSSGFPSVYKRIREFGDVFDVWQQGMGTLVFGKRANGDYAATIGGVTLSIPRQVAKTYFVGRIVFALCTLFPNLRVIWTAHRTRTATNTFNSLRRFAGRRKVAPFVRAIRATNGEQEISFVNGSVIMFGAREQGFGRGFDEVDVEVFDEAQILTEKALEDMIAATNQSRHPHGALIFYMGTPPRPVDPGEAFKSRRREALEVVRQRADDPNVEFDAVYIECSADPDADPDDRVQWRKANPSFPKRTPLRSMLRLRKNLVSDEAWKREALGVWDSDQEGSRAIKAHEWDATGVAEAPSDGDRVFSVAFSLDGSRLALAGGLKHADGVHAELVDAAQGDVASGLAGLADWLAARWRRVAEIVLCGQAGAPVLRQLLRDRDVPESVIRVASTVEYTTACSVALDAVRASAVAVRGGGAPEFTHLVSEGQLQLDESVSVCDKKARGSSGAWGWSATTADGDETPLEAVSLAYWLAKTTRRKPYGEKERRAVFL